MTADLWYSLQIPDMPWLWDSLCPTLLYYSTAPLITLLVSMPILTGRDQSDQPTANTGWAGPHFRTNLSPLTGGWRTTQGARPGWSPTSSPALLVLALMKLSQIISNWASSRDYIQIISDTFTPSHWPALPWSSLTSEHKTILRDNYGST